MEKNRSMTIRLTQDLHDRLEARAKKEGLTVSEWARTVLTERLIHRVRYVDERGKGERC